MKKYENHYRFKVLPRSPVIIRVDGKAFHTLTRDCTKPFDESFGECMDYTARMLVEEVQNARIAYVQSDEISLLLVDYNTYGTQQWFDGNLQKMVSISASVASVAFSSYWESPAYFDSRAFVLPREEVTNYFIWRQQDATRNSIQMVGQAYFSHKELQRKSCNDIQHMLLTEKNVNWDKVATEWKRGRCFYRIPGHRDIVEDFEIPVFTQDRQFIEQFLNVELDEQD